MIKNSSLCRCFFLLDRCLEDWLARMRRVMNIKKGVASEAWLLGWPKTTPGMTSRVASRRVAVAIW